MSTAIVWFRQDLRCHDNQALADASLNHERVIPIYIREHQPVVPMGGAQKWWLHHSLQALENELKKYNLALTLHSGEPLAIIQKLIATYGVDSVYWNRCYEPAFIARDMQIKKQLKVEGVNVQSFNSNLLLEPWEITNKSGGYFKVFTPFWKTCFSRIKPRPLYEMQKMAQFIKPTSEPLEGWELLPKNPDWAKEFALHWRPGEQHALEQLNHFIESHLGTYKEQRNVPGAPGTSRLSPHLHFGELSPQWVWQMVHQQLVQAGCLQESALTFLSELGWREFSYHLLYHFPQLPEKSFKSTFDHYPWQNDDELLKRWQLGMTGYPIVDAGMRELWRTGYMHNRVRMIVASFLTKDLFIDWRKGAAWFWDTLLDADLASNSASWQWVAGCGVDAAPYYRIFNPTLQGEKFDPDGVYIRQWVPELAHIPKQWLHKPWEAPKEQFPKGYPLPIVDHAIARQMALMNYQKLTPSS